MESLNEVVGDLVQQLRDLAPPQPGARRKRAAHLKKLEQLQLADPKVIDYLGAVQADLLGLARVLPPRRPKVEE